MTLRALLDEKRIIRAVGAHDAITAKLAERHGFDAIWASGLGISAAHGVRDDGTLGLAKMLAAAEVISQACVLPVIADCDIGFGDADAFAHAVREYGRAGIAAVCIEDQAFPKRNSLDEQAEHRLASIDEFSAKLSAGHQARVSAEFVLVARVEAFIVGLGEDEAIRRAAAYADAGADAILIHSRRSDADEVVSFARRWQGRQPLVVVPTTYPNVTTAQLEEARVRMVIYANEALRAGVTAVDDALQRIKQEGSAGGLQSEIAPVSEILDLHD